MDSKFKDQLEKAYARFVRDLKKSPDQAKDMKVTMKMLLPNLQEIDDCWRNIPPEQMVGTGPRTLIQRMNVHKDRWMKEPASV